MARDLTFQSVEVAFVDPAVPDLTALLAGLRPEVQAHLLDGATPALKQIAQALEARGGADILHIIAHGAPGAVCFAAGTLSAATLEDHQAELSSIRRSLQGGDFLLW